MLSRLGALGARFAKIGLVLVLLSAAFVVVAQSVRAQTPAGGLSCAMTRAGEYEKADPAAAGLDPERLKAALDYANLSNPLTMKVFRHGCLLGEGVRDPLFDRVPANNWGQTKTITALITGIAQDQNLVDIDAPIGAYLPADLGDAAHRAVTLRNLLQASSGVEINQVRGLNFFADQSRAREFFTMPIVNEPGTYFEYDQTAVSVIIYVVQHAIWEREPGLDFQDYAQRELFDQLGIPTSAYFWQRDRAGTTTGYSQLFLRPLETGRLGELIRSGGVYDGQRVISERYLRELRTAARTNCGYGFLTFLNSCQSGQTQVDVSVPTRRDAGGVPWIASAPADMVFTDGVGIRTFVIPSLELVVTRSGEQELDLLPSALRRDVEGVVPGRPGAAGTHEFFRLLMAAVTDLPDEVRATIASFGPYDRAPEVGFDATHFLHPLDAPAGSYLSVGPGAAQGCNPLGCEGEPNDGTQRWVGDVPRTVPGIVGADTRPGGASCAMTRTGEYEKADPAAAGLDPVKLKQTLDYADLQSSLSIKVFRHGCLLGQGVRDPLFERVPANNYGQTKAVAALITGIAQDKGYLDIDAPIGTYLPADLGDAAHRAVTLRNLLQEASGIQVNNVRGLNFYADQSRPREFFAMGFDHEPGTYFEYDETGPSVVTYVVQHAIWRHEPGLDFQAFAQRELFDQLGIPTSAYFWQRDRAGNTEGYSQLFLRPLEFGRLGQLWLTDGVYQGKRVISERFMRELRTPSRANCGFGFFVWLNSCRAGEPQANIDIPIRRQFPGVPWVASAPADMVFTVGLGNRTFVIPSLDLVVTRSGEVELDTVPSATMLNTDGVVAGRTGEAGTHEFFRLLMAAVTDLPDQVRATIANSGPYDRAPEVGADLSTFLHPLDAAPGTYASVGPGAPEGCHPLGCEGEPHDGTQRWVGDIPRTVPGTVGAETRPDGPE